jgi:thiamine kinase-like enzyme
MQEVKSLNEINDSLVNLLGSPIIHLEEISGGNNNRIFKIECDDSRNYAVKFYFRNPKDRRDRLGTEFKALRFLSSKGVKSVPMPIKADAKHGIGIYEFIEGRKIASLEITDTDIDTAVHFVGLLKGLRAEGENAAFVPASEAYFSVQAIIENISSRLRMLTRSTTDGKHHRALESYLRNDFMPLFEKVTQRSRYRLGEIGDLPEQEIAIKDRVLSPSDFGFHNTLRRNDGEIIFLDFEYFGFDDPAKLISDFILHPGMQLSDGLKQRFIFNILSLFEFNKRLIKRVKMLYPLFGLKWCMILLNEFVLESVQRRIFSGGKKLIEINLERQLGKAKEMTYKVMKEYEEFPFQTI